MQASTHVKSTTEDERKLSQAERMYEKSADYLYSADIVTTTSGKEIKEKLGKFTITREGGRKANLPSRRTDMNMVWY